MCHSVYAIYLGFTANASALNSDATQVPLLSGDNFKDWKEQVLFKLGCMDLDLAIRVNEPASLIDASTNQERTDYEK